MSTNNSKRKAVEEAATIAAADAEDGDSDDSSSSYDPSVINVDFDFLAPSEIDFQAIKRLLQQLFYTHAASGAIELSTLTQHVLDMASNEKTALGTVIKVEGDEDMDPFAFISAVDLSAKETASSAASAGREMSKYFQARLASPSFSTSSSTSTKALQALFASSSEASPLLILHERMINLPPATAPPLYRMVLDEVAQAEKVKDFTHLVFFSRTFSSDALSDDEQEKEDGDDGNERREMQGRKATVGANRTKRRKAQVKKAVRNETIIKGSVEGSEDDNEEMLFFHPEDRLIAKRASHTFTFRYPAPKDAAKDFEAPLFGRIAVIPRDEKSMAQLIEEMQAAFEGTAPMALE